MTYTYYNTRYKAKPLVFTTKYYSYFNHYNLKKNTKNIVYAYQYSYGTSYCKGPAIIQSCDVVEKKGAKCTTPAADFLNINFHSDECKG